MLIKKSVSAGKNLQFNYFSLLFQCLVVVEKIIDLVFYV